jgi:hypothetical protein
MLFLLTLLAATPASVGPAEPVDAEEIVVVGERLKRIKIDTRRDRKTGQQQCKVRRSSGDAVLDAAVCDAVLACAKVARVSAEMEACVAPRFTEIVRHRARK